MHDKKSSKLMKGCWSAVQTNGFTFTHVAALLTEFSVICALLMKKNFFHAEMANQMKTETSSIRNSTSSKRR